MRLSLHLMPDSDYLDDKSAHLPHPIEFETQGSVSLSPFPLHPNSSDQISLASTHPAVNNQTRCVSYSTLSVPYTLVQEGEGRSPCCGLQISRVRGLLWST